MTRAIGKRHVQAHPHIILPGKPAPVQMPPVAAYNPPIQPSAPAVAAPPVMGVGANYEAYTARIAWTQLITSDPQNSQPIYVTKKRWRGIEIYVDNDSPTWPLISFVSVFVWAISAQGARTLVASGRYEHPFSQASGANVAPGPLRVLAKCANAERYEVTATYQCSSGPQFGPPTGGSGFCNITIVASDEVVEDDGQTGCLVRTGTSFFNNASPTPRINFPELCGITGANTAGGTPAAPAARWLHVYFSNVTNVAQVNRRSARSDLRARKPGRRRLSRLQHPSTPAAGPQRRKPGPHVPFGVRELDRPHDHERRGLPLFPVPAVRYPHVAPRSPLVFLRPRIRRGPGPWRCGMWPPLGRRTGAANGRDDDGESRVPPPSRRSPTTTRRCIVSARRPTRSRRSWRP
jgi:hypothetical protein